MPLTSRRLTTPSPPHSGPAAINLFDPTDWGGTESRAPGGHITDEITLEVMRVTIALSVFAVGVELPKKYLLRHWRSMFMLLGPVMIWGWLVTAGFIRLLVPGLDFLNSLVVAACVTPTDPILAQAVVGGPWAEKHVPAHLRHMLQCESGCNDGAAFPFLYLALFLTTHRGNTREAIAEWFYDALGYQIIFGTILGAIIGWVARKAMRFSERHRLVDRESFVAQYVSLAIASMGVNVLLGSDDLLAAFACGTAFAWDGWFTKQTEDSNFSNIIDLLFNVATFIYIGALMPWYEFAHAADSLNIWRCFVLAIAVLLLKRLPIILALWRWIPDIKTFREAIFSGHFGPMGVGAIFIATLGRSELPEEIPDPPESTNDVLALTIQPIVFFLVLCSITIHGLTVPFFAFSKRAHTITRTWSRNPSFMDADAEPSWTNRLRRFRTGETMQSNKEVEGGGMTEIQRVLNAQLGVIGKGAIGGDAEKELRESPGDSAGSSADSSDGNRTRVGLLNTRTERDLELAEGDMDSEEEEKQRQEEIDDLEDWMAEEAEDPSSEWGGDDTAEAKLYKAKQAQKRAAARRQREAKTRTSAEGDQGDLGEAPMDRDLIWGTIDEKDEDEDAAQDKEGQAKSAAATQGGDKQGSENEYPKARSWLEGHQLLIEYMESRLAEPQVHVVDLSPEEAEQIAEVAGTDSDNSSVAYAWLSTHADELDEHVSDGSHRGWHPRNAALELIRSGGLQSWLHAGSRNRSKRKGPRAQEDPPETDEQRNDRASMLYAAMASRPDQGTDSDGSPDLSKQGTHVQSSDNDEAIDSASSSSLALPEIARPSPRNASSPPRRQKSPPLPRRRSSSGPGRPMPPRQHFAGSGRRSSMRRKVLAGRIGFGQGPGKGDADDDEDEVIEEPAELDTDGGKFPRTGSIGGLSPSSELRSPGLLRSPSDLERERRAHNRTPSSVSFVNTMDTKHDRAARGNTFSSGSSSSAAASSPTNELTRARTSSSVGQSGGDSGSVKGDDDGDASTTASTSRSTRRGGGSRFSALLSSLTGSSSSKQGDAVPEEEPTAGTDARTAEGPEANEEEPRGRDAAPGSSSSQRNIYSFSHASMPSGDARGATPGPTTRTHPSASESSAGGGTGSGSGSSFPTEGILMTDSNPATPVQNRSRSRSRGGAGDEAGAQTQEDAEAPSVAFDLPPTTS